jgi:hypothetical protein
MGRPRIKIDRDKVVELASKGATIKYIASFFAISEATLYRRFDAAIEIGRSLRDGTLQMRQFESAMAGNSVMLKWLGQQWLGQKDKLETTEISYAKGYGSLPIPAASDLGRTDQPN